MVGKALVLFLLFGSLSGAPSSLDSYSVSLRMEGDTLVRVIEFSGTQGSDRLLSRIPLGFEPSCQSVALETALFAEPGGEFRDVPPWAVDTLTGGSSWRRSLVTAFPGLVPGSSVRYRAVVRDWSGKWSMGPWAVLLPVFRGMVPDSCVFVLDGEMMEDLYWSGSGYTSGSRDGNLVLTASELSGELVVTPFRDFSQLEEFILMDAIPVLASPHPPDLREAALQTSGAGAGSYAQTMRARTLLCNSFAPSAILAGQEPYSVRGIQEILDTREATPLEMAVVYAALCSELGLTAELVPAGGDTGGLPVPAGWDRFLVRVESEDGDHWYTEPSAYLSRASWVFRPDTLGIILDGRAMGMPPNPPQENSCTETWTLDPALGTFRLDLETSGWFDMNLRRRTAGLPPEMVLLTMAEWSWRSGRTVVPEEASMSDPYELDRGMSLSLAGSAGFPLEGGPGVETLPVLDWARPDTVPGLLVRRWVIRDFTVIASEGTVSVGLEGSDSMVSHLQDETEPVTVVLEASR